MSETVGREHLFAVILRIKTLCEASQNGETVMRFVLARMRILLPVLQLLSACPQFRNLQETLYRELKLLKATIKRLGKMNRIVYLVQAAKLHDDLLEGHFLQIANILFPAREPSSDFVDPKAVALSNALAFFFQQSDQQDREFATFQQAVKKEQALWVSPDANALEVFIQVLGGDVTLEEAQAAQRQLQRDLEAIHKQLLKPSTGNHGLTDNPMARSKILEHQIYWAAMVEKLAQALPASEEPVLPPWAFDAITQKVMVDPVLVRADCQHTVSKSTLESWLEQGHKTCPVCKIPLKALYATPNRELQRKIQKLSSDSNLDDNQSKRQLLDESSHHYSSSRLNMDDSWSKLLDTFDSTGVGDAVLDMSRHSYKSVGNTQVPEPAEETSQSITNPRVVRRTSESAIGRLSARSRSTSESSIGGLSNKMNQLTFDQNTLYLEDDIPEQRSSDPLPRLTPQQLQHVKRGSLHTSSAHSAIRTKVTIAHPEQKSMARRLSSKMGKLLSSSAHGVSSGSRRNIGADNSLRNVHVAGGMPNRRSMHERPKPRTSLMTAGGHPLAMGRQSMQRAPSTQSIYG